MYFSLCGLCGKKRLGKAKKSILDLPLTTYPVEPLISGDNVD